MTEKPPASIPSTQDFPRRERIAARSDFLAAYEEGRKEFSRYCVVFTRTNAFGHPRIGITVTKKAGKANVRNRLKRWVREIWRRGRAELKLAETSLDFVVNVKPAAASANFDEFATDLRRGLRRAAFGR
ncbi:MAG: ribonuclease P protein component [Acidobacteriota bacterium]